MSRRLVDWKNSRTRLDQIDSISSYISKHIFNRPLPNLTQLRDTIDTVQHKQKSKPKKSNPPQSSSPVNRRITRNSTANMSSINDITSRESVVPAANKRQHSDSNDEVDAVSKKPRKDDSSQLMKSPVVNSNHDHPQIPAVNHSTDNVMSEEVLSSIQPVSVPIFPRISLGATVATDLSVNESVLSNSLNDFFAAFLQIISLLTKNYSYSTNRMLLYYHEILKVLFYFSFFGFFFFFFLS
jgi:hypothetical protein